MHSLPSLHALSTSVADVRTLTLAGRLLEQRTTPESGWIEWLKARIDLDWRPGEFDAYALLLQPSPGNRDNALTTCLREACGVHLFRGRYCAGCRREYRLAGSELPIDAWLAQAGPRLRPKTQTHCDVAGCLRTHAARGLCQSHVKNYLSWVKRRPSLTVAEWIVRKKPAPFPKAARCRVNCYRDVQGDDLCGVHSRSYREWVKGRHPSETSIELWGKRHVEPEPLDGSPTYAQLTATPFGLLPEPLRWKLLYATQERDRLGKMLNATILRSLYLNLREEGAVTVVGPPQPGSHRRREEPDRPREQSPAARRRRPSVLVWRRRPRPPGHLAQRHRAAQVLEDHWPQRHLRPSQHPPGLDCDGDRLLDQRDPTRLPHRAGHGRGLDGCRRRTRTAKYPHPRPGRAGHRRVVNAIRGRWDAQNYRRRAISAIRELLAYTRARDEFSDTWGAIPGRFSINRSRHQATGTTKRSGAADEPYRFVPQPIIEHLMNNLDLLVRTTPYATAEARAMLYIHERCGRRTNETTKLFDDCITYDNEGTPYLEWERGKPPYTRGPRLPIHQETHDGIRQWQEIKRAHGVTSKWLFPKTDANSSVDKHWHPQYLGARLGNLLDGIEAHAPINDPVVGIDGNLVYFDLGSIDPYAFRHAFAQRYADATDENGNPTTPADVLQDLMGHSNFLTTMAYYEVSAKRRKRAMHAVAPRRLNLHGEVVRIDPDRKGFTRVAVTLGHCMEPQNMAAHGHGCMIDHACESCPFFLVDPLERDGLVAKRHHLMVQLERASVIGAQQHLLDHYEARIKDCTALIDGIDAHIDSLPENERGKISEALSRMGRQTLRPSAKPSSRPSPRRRRAVARSASPTSPIARGCPDSSSTATPT